MSQSLDFSRAVLERDPDDAAQRLVTAAASEGLAALSHTRGKPADAEKLWRSALEIRTELAQLETHNVTAQAALGLALAHSGRRDEALKKAEALLKANADRPAVLVKLTQCFAACAAGGTNDVERRRARALALDALGAAVRNGYRDQVAIRTDPDFAPLRCEPGLKNLMDGIKP